MLGISPRLKADPAVLFLTLCAGHVIAPVELIACNLTSRARLRVNFLRPLDKLCVQEAALSTMMVCLPALEANLLPTLARNLFLKAANLFDVSIAARARAPFELWIQLDVDVQFELEILFVYVFGA